jgi:hypothetical protein
MGNIQGQRLGEWNSLAGTAEITAKKKLSTHSDQFEAHKAIAKTGEAGAIIKEADGKFSAWSIDDGAYTDDLNVGEKATTSAQGKAAGVVDFIGEDGGSLSSGAIVKPPTGPDRGQKVYMMHGMGTPGLRGAFERVTMDGLHRIGKRDDVRQLQKMGYSVVVDNSATLPEIKNAIYDPKTAGLVYLGHGGGGGIVTYDDDFLMAQDIDAKKVSPNLKMVFWQSCEAGQAQKEWEKAFGPQTTVYAWDRAISNGEMLLINGGNNWSIANPHTWSGTTLNQTIERHLK